MLVVSRRPFLDCDQTQRSYSDDLKHELRQWYGFFWLGKRHKSSGNYQLDLSLF
ncbi:MAG: hypothetical protein O4861_00080 [Trichodesmium sp. St16_bin4-tuft]|nr:hypothetical protein [Trichodesmium sp. MAG_R01]MDE5071890.1 hypothetical protein [Trichodesmium sp. St5_bin8]MDE5096818.1 hypothetical protein [Trichodesmium sp. St16_bin4-tuft]MDE5102635.1 hypothetical protein [Trichodesmium sp. St19_bin2]